MGGRSYIVRALGNLMQNALNYSVPGDTVVPKAGKSGGGLDLHLVKNVVNMHGGRVELDTEEGGGSTFRMIFPTGGTD